MKVYKPQKKYVLGSGLTFMVLVFFLLTLPVIVANEPPEKEKLIALIGFWLLGVMLTALPFGFRLEVGSHDVRSRFFGLLLSSVNSSDIKVVQYGNLYQGGLGFGKGINYTTLIKGKSKSYSISENFYGKEAIEHVRNTLGKNS